MNAAHRFFIISLIIIILTAISTSIVSASSIIYNNDFESDTVDSFPSGWSIDRNLQWGNHSLPCMNGSTPAQWQVKNAFGSNRVGISINGSGCVTEITPTNLVIPDLSNYQYEVDITFPNSVNLDRNIAFKYHNGGEWYGIKFVHQYNIEFQKVMHPNSYNSHLGNAIFPSGFQPNQTYHLTIKVVDNLISFYINGELIKSVQDQAPILNQGKIALQASIGSLGPNTTYFDNVKVTDLSGPETLNVPLILQNDPLWGSLKYDSLNKTIGEVGCALASISMVLNYYGYTLPDGSPITPANLNNLLMQADKYGYGRNGYINFATVASLTDATLITTNPNVKHLEYKRLTPRNLTIIDRIIEDQKHPIIFDQYITGSSSGHHFSVGEGVYTPGTVYAVKDPYNANKVKLDFTTEHFASARHFEPQNTNFSYLMLQADEAVYPMLTDPANHQTGTQDGSTILEDIEDSSFVKEGVLDNSQNPGDEEGSPFWNLETKYPESGEYTLSFSANQSGWYDFELYAYSQGGGIDVVKQNIFVMAGQPTIYKLVYNQEGGDDFATLVPTSFLNLIERIRQLKDQQKIQPKSADQLIKFAENSQKVYGLNHFAGKKLLEVLKLHINNDFKQGKILIDAKNILVTEIDFYLEVL